MSLTLFALVDLNEVCKRGFILVIQVVTSIENSYFSQNTAMLKEVALQRWKTSPSDCQYIDYIQRNQHMTTHRYLAKTIKQRLFFT